MITLEQGGFELEVSPELGGAITRFAVRGNNVLRPAPRNPASVLEAGCFPLVPYANRIANGTFRFEGRECRLPLNFGEHPHSLHGHGWQTGWRVESISRAQATLAFDHAADAWPWAYSAEETVSLGADTLQIKLSLRNRDTKPMPFSLGLHPYFPRSAGSRVTAAVTGMWQAGATMIPTEHVEGSRLIDLARGVVVAQAPFVDNAFTGWRSTARIEQPDDGLAVSLEASPECRFLHVFIPTGASYFCAEPVTAMPNAFNRPEPPEVTGARVLAPGKTFAVEMRLVVRTR